MRRMGNRIVKTLVGGIFAAVAFAAVNVHASPLAAEQPLSKNIVVANKHFSCTFFPRHMFPVWFKKPDGTKFPEMVRFLDRLVIGKLHYLLFADLWAEQEVLKNTEDEFVIRCSGVYVRITGDTVAPGAAYSSTVTGPSYSPPPSDIATGATREA